MLKPDDLVRHSGFVRALAGQLVRDRAAADDIAQDALLVGLERPPSRPGNHRGWLRRVVTSVARKRARGDERRLRRERTVARPEASAADDAAARLETERRLVESVLSLDEPYRSTIVLRFLDGLSIADVARRQGVPLGTAETRLRRALEQLRGRLGRAWSAALLPLAGIESKAARRAAGVLAMASKATVAVAGFLCGVGATALYTGLSAPPPQPGRAAPREATHLPDEAAAVAPAAEPSPPRPQSISAAAPSEYLRRINEAPDEMAAYRIAQEIATLPAQQGRDIMLGIFREITAAEKRRIALSAFVGIPHTFVLDILDLGATDADPTNRAVALGYLRPFSLRAFQEDPDAYGAWRARHAGQALPDVFRDSARAFVARVSALDGAALEKELRLVDQPPRAEALAVAAALREAGLPELVERWLRDPMPDETNGEAYEHEREVRRAAWRWLEAAQPNEAYLRRVVVPILEDAARNVEEADSAANVLGRTKAPWVVDPLLRYLHRMDLSKLSTFGIGRALGSSGQKRAIPHMIAAITLDNTYATVYGFGSFGLTPLTGVIYDESHDGAWWLRWWDMNKDGLPAEARALDPRALARDFGR